MGNFKRIFPGNIWKYNIFLTKMRSTCWNNNIKLIKLNCLFFIIKNFVSTGFFFTVILKKILFFRNTTLYPLIILYTLTYFLYYLLFYIFTLKIYITWYYLFLIQSYGNTIYYIFHSFTVIIFQYNQLFYYIFIFSEKFPVHVKIFYISHKK